MKRWVRQGRRYCLINNLVFGDVVAAKIPFARLKSDPSNTIKASDYDKKLHGKVLCPDSRCLCGVQGVKAESRTIKDGDSYRKVDVSPFFRLPPNAEKKGLGHQPRCRYNVDRFVKKYVATSKEIKKFDPDADPIFASGNRIAEYRLHILMEALKVARYLSSINGEYSGSDIAKAVEGKKYIRTDKVLRPYFRVARAIMWLIARISDRKELAKWIRLKYGSESIGWDEYYYDIHEHGRLHKYLMDIGQSERREGGERPVAVAINIPANAKVRPTRYGKLEVLCEGTKVPLENGNRIFIRPILYVKNPQWVEAILKEQTVLICAIPTTEHPKEPYKSPEPKQQGRWAGYTFLPEARIRIPIIDRSQFCRYNPDELK